MPCGLADLAPGAPDPVVAGEAAMQLPAAIGDIVVRGCGCHLADDLAADVPDYPSTGALQLTTWTQWHAPFGTTTTPTFEIVASRLVLDGPAGMPPPSACDVGDGATMDPADRTALLDWIAAGAPDGATWPPG